MLAAILLAGVTLFVGLTQTGFGDATRVVGRVFHGPESRPAAHVIVMAASNSDVRTTITDSHGRYAFLTLLPGVYRLAACGEAMDEGAVVRTLRSCADEDSFLELSAGVEYLANLSLGPNCNCP